MFGESKMAIQDHTAIEAVDASSRTTHFPTPYSDLRSKLHSILHPSSNSLSISHGRVPNALTISLERTIRLPDTAAATRRPASFLPPSLGSFLLYSVDKYRHKLPPAMRRKGGIFIGMYQHEALWLRFHAHEPFAVRVFVGGVNVVSGKGVDEASAPATGLDFEQQNFVAVPEQTSLDGTVTARGEVRQFVAVRAGGGYSVEAQVNGKQEIGGLQFEVTPVKRVCPEMIVTKLGDKEVEIKLREKGLDDKSRLDDLKRVIADALDLPPLWLQVDLEMTNKCFPGMQKNMDFRDLYVAEGQVINVIDKVARAADLARTAEIKRLELEELKWTHFVTRSQTKAKESGRPTDGMLTDLSSTLCFQEQLRKWEATQPRFGIRQAQHPNPIFGSSPVAYGSAAGGTAGHGLFGGGVPNQNQNQVSAGGLLRGSAQTCNPPQTGGLFGSTAQPAQRPASTTYASDLSSRPAAMFSSTDRGAPDAPGVSVEERRYTSWEAAQITSELNSVLSTATQMSQSPLTINLTLPVTVPSPEPAPIIDTADKELHLAPGARIAQTLRASAVPHTLWDTAAALLFNIQILNSAAFKEIVGVAPEEPISAKRYSEIGGVLFDLESGDSEGVDGGSGGLVSVGEKDEGKFGEKVEGFWENLRSAGRGEEGDGEERLEFRIARIVHREAEKVEE